MTATRSGVRTVILLVGILTGCSAWALRAGTVYAIADGAETSGKLTLTTSAIHVEGTSASDINLPDVLEADFTDAPFQLDYFRPRGDTLNHLPDEWKAQDLEPASPAGTFTYVNGVLTLTGIGADLQRQQPEDKLYFIGRPWTGDGEWMIHVSDLDGTTGVMLRDNLDHGAPMFAIAVGSSGSGIFQYRGKAGDHVGWRGGFPVDNIPVWVRLKRCGSSIDGDLSIDGQKWETFGQNDTGVSTNAWVGFFVSSNNEKVTARTVLDHIAFTPRLAEPKNLIPGGLLRSGTFLAGIFYGIDAKGGTFNRHDKGAVTLTNEQICAYLLRQVTLPQITEVASQPGIILKNGDFMASDLGVIQGTCIQMNSVLIGPVTYYSDMVRACILHPLQTKASDYEIRLTDGSIIRADSIAMNNGQFVIQETSGATIPVGANEIAQVRAGVRKVQPLIDLPWKASTLPLAPVEPAVPPPTATNLAPVAPGTSKAPLAPAVTNAPAAGVPPAVPAVPDIPGLDKAPLVQAWEGNNQEQMLVASAGTTIDFPLVGKFRAVAMRIAVAPDALPNIQATVRFLADGQEVGRTLPFKAGDQPRFVEITLPQPKTLTMEVDSFFPNASLLFIDPVAIRSN